MLGDDLLLQQAFLNILINAEHAIAEAGAGRHDRHQHRVERGRPDAIVTRSATRARASPATVLPRIFDPFFTTKDVGPGHRARPHDHLRHRPGARRHASRRATPPDGGAVFTIELPVADVAAEPSTVGYR